MNTQHMQPLDSTLSGLHELWPEEDHWLIELLGQSASLTLQYFRKKLRTIEKPDNQGVVTEADTEVEQLLIQTIRQRTPEATFIAEESHPRSDIPPSQGDSIWVIDPIDGTANFCRSHAYFCTSLCRGRLSEEGLFSPELAVILAPALGTLTWARAGQGAFAELRPISMAKRETPYPQQIATCLGMKGEENRKLTLESMQRLSTVTRSIRVCGAAALDLAYTARGAYDAFFELHLMPWDLAAGALICQESGLRVESLETPAFNALLNRSICVACPSHFDAFKDCLSTASKENK